MGGFLLAAGADEARADAREVEALRAVGEQDRLEPEALEEAGARLLVGARHLRNGLRANRFDDALRLLALDRRERRRARNLELVESGLQATIGEE